MRRKMSWDSVSLGASVTNTPHKVVADHLVAEKAVDLPQPVPFAGVLIGALVDLAWSGKEPRVPRSHGGMFPFEYPVLRLLIPAEPRHWRHPFHATADQPYPEWLLPSSAD